MAVSKKNARQRFLNAATACTLTGAICLIIFSIQVVIVHGQFGLGFDLRLIWYMFNSSMGWFWAWPAIGYIGLRWGIRPGHAWAVISALSLLSLHAAAMLLLIILSILQYPELIVLLTGLCTLCVLTMSIVFLARCIPALSIAKGEPRGFEVVPMGAPLGNPIPPARDSHSLPSAALSERSAPPPIRPTNEERVKLD